MRDRLISNGLRTLAVVSKIEEDLESSLASDAVDALTADHTGDADGPSTAELDALDESLVESIEEYASSEPDQPTAAEAGTVTSDMAEVNEDATSDTADVAEVPTGVLEELRRADIDGPVVDHAPQDDTTSSRRRPKRPVDYDPAPVPVPLKVPRILGRKPRVRKVTRVVRHVDPWSVFKIALLTNLVLYVIVLTAGVLLWNVAYATGTVENVERFFESFGWQSFEFNGGELYHSAWIAGLFAVLGLTGLWVLLATLFNLITDLVGGARFTVLEEEVVESRTSPMRRFVVRRPEPEIPVTLSDASGPLIREAIIDDTGDIER